MQKPHLSVVRAGDLPPPPMPPDVDLSEMPRALVDINEMSNSMFAATSTPAGFKAAWRLYGNSVHQIPAGSVPDDDRKLAFLAGYGMDVAGWTSVKEEVLDAWTLHADGRFYRKDLSILLLDVWIKRLSARMKQAASVAKRKKADFNAEPYAKPLSAAVDALYVLAPQSKVLRNYLNGRLALDSLDDEQDGSDICPANDPDTARISEAKQSESKIYIAPTGRSPVGAGHPDEDSAGGEGVASSVSHKTSAGETWPEDAFERFWEAFPHKVGKIAARDAFAELIRAPPVPHHQFMLAVLRYATHNPPSYDWAHPATWLNKKRWTDVWPDKPPDRGSFAPRPNFPRSSPRPFQPTGYRGRSP